MIWRPFALLLLLVSVAWPVLAQGASGSLRLLNELANTERVALATPDTEALRLADEERVVDGRVAHFSTPQEVKITPWSNGRWEILRSGHIRWRLRIASPGALSLSFAFDRYSMPAGGRLRIFSLQGGQEVGSFTDADNEAHSQLWSPPFLGDEALLEITIPFEQIDELQLRLTRVHHGYAGFGEPEPKAGSCHRDVVCSEGALWSDATRSVAMITVEGVRFCTGFLVNNTALDGRPFFLTASHCGIGPENAASVVVLWNHESPVCRDENAAKIAGSADATEVVDHLKNFQTGALFRAAFRPTDMVLLELDDPPKAEFAAYFAGWDRSGDPVTSSVVIHHPNTDAKRISFDFDAASTTLHLLDEPQRRGNHLRIANWDLGTTEGGSSGGPLFNREKRVVGVLHGGHAACGNQAADWFGRLATAWHGGGRPGTRLSDWLDPIGSDVTALDGLDVTPESP
jgi:hypothetical protein